MTCSFDIQLGNNIIQEPFNYFTQSLGLKETDLYVIPSDFFFLNTTFYSRDTTQGNEPRGTSLIKAIFTIHRIASAQARKPYH